MRDADWAHALVARIVEDFPVRRACSPQERQAQALVAEELAKLGLDPGFEGFVFNDNLYAVLALHFGLATLGTVVGGVLPPVGLALHLLAGESYRQDSVHRRYILRRLFPYRNSQNLVATSRSEGPIRKRVVFLAHIDAAFTGFVFHPETVRRAKAERLPEALGFLKRPLALATKAQYPLAAIDALRCVLGPLMLPLRPVEYALTIPALVTFLLNLEVVIRNETVPGAADNLSGVAGLVVLAERLLKRQPRDVEYVFVVTGAEEAGLGGADALCRERLDTWNPEDTVIIGLDTLAGGDLCYLGEGEVQRVHAAPWLDHLVREIAGSEERFGEVAEYPVPVGASDVMPFLARGYDGLCVSRVDRKLGAPRNYHLPSDTAENMSGAEIIEAIDFTQMLVERIVGAGDRRSALSA